MSENKTESRYMVPTPDFNKIAHGERWWNTGPWKGPNVVPATPDDSLFRTQSPECKHNRCAHTQIECEVCAVYSAEYLTQWRAEKEKADGSGK